MIDGEWAWRHGRPAGVGEYAFDMSGPVGICTRTNAPSALRLGHVIFTVTGTHGPLLLCLQKFTDGRWVEVVAASTPDTLYLVGGGWNWTMTRLGGKAHLHG